MKSIDSLLTVMCQHKVNKVIIVFIITHCLCSLAKNPQFIPRGNGGTKCFEESTVTTVGLMDRARQDRNQREPIRKHKEENQFYPPIISIIAKYCLTIKRKTIDFYI